ncbi:unnamed protein product [Chrysoparadoxa australica]
MERAEGGGGGSLTEVNERLRGFITKHPSFFTCCTDEHGADVEDLEDGGGKGSGRDSRSSSSERGFGRKGRKRRLARSGSFNSTLVADDSFHNPHAVKSEVAKLGLVEQLSFVVDVGMDGVGEEDWFHDTVRQQQDLKWARERVAKGAAIARGGSHSSAMKYYDQALSLMPNHVDAIIAKGAAQASLGQLNKAVTQFNKALSIDPTNSNATAYLAKTNAKLQTLSVARRGGAPPPAAASASASGAASSSSSGIAAAREAISAGAGAGAGIGREGSEMSMTEGGRESNFKVS